MEGRRVEGVFLQHTIERSQILEVYKQAQRIQIRVLTLVPDIFLETLGRKGTQFKATVGSVGRNKVLLNLPNGYQVEAENRLSFGVSKGDVLTLLVENENPITLQIISIERGIRNVNKLIKNFIEQIPAFTFLMKGIDIKNLVENSGIFYESKLAKVLTGKKDISILETDEKFVLLKKLTEGNKQELMYQLNQLADRINNEKVKDKINTLLEAVEKGNIKDILSTLKGIKNMSKIKEHSEIIDTLLKVVDSEIGKDLEKLEFINFMQNILISEKGKRFAFGFEEENIKGSVIFSLKESYRIFFNLFYEEGYIGIIMEAPRKKNIDFINITFFTDIRKLAYMVEREKEQLNKLLRKENLEIGTFQVRLERKEEFENKVKEEFAEGIFHLRV